jgi:hypothetical protein
MSLHTLPECNMPPASGRMHRGTPTAETCDARMNYNQGCGVQSASDRSFGSAFNAAGGGWFAMRRTKRDGIAVWFWPRDDPSVPVEIAGVLGASSSSSTNSGSTGNAGGLDVSVLGSLGQGLNMEAGEGKLVIEPSEHWGTPDAVFPPATCAMDRYFDPHVLVFDLTFCGDWAGEPSVWATSGCGLPLQGACNACEYASFYHLS